MFSNSMIVIALAMGVGVGQATPTARVRRDTANRYCIKHFDHYQKYCADDSFEATRETFGKIAKFCPAYQKHCAVGKTGVVELPDLGSSLVLPPSLERGSQNRLLDLPIMDSSSSSSDSFESPKENVFSFPSPSKRGLTAAIIATCTPDCTAPQCTDDCKCAHTHPKVHQMCNPPSSASMAQTCQRWYAKCTMFAPVQY